MSAKHILMRGAVGVGGALLAACATPGKEGAWVAPPPELVTPFPVAGKPSESPSAAPAGALSLGTETDLLASGAVQWAENEPLTSLLPPLDLPPSELTLPFGPEEASPEVAQQAVQSAEPPLPLQSLPPAVDPSTVRAFVHALPALTGASVAGPLLVAHLSADIFPTADTPPLPAALGEETISAPEPREATEHGEVISLPVTPGGDAEPPIALKAPPLPRRLLVLFQSAPAPANPPTALTSEFEAEH